MNEAVNVFVDHSMPFFLYTYRSIVHNTYLMNLKTSYIKVSAEARLKAWARVSYINDWFLYYW